MYEKYLKQKELSHHGILGQKWGVRRYQNKDGTLTQAGLERYTKNVLKNSKANNVSKFGTDSNHNVLYITGISGSGKSTVAKYYSDKYKSNRIVLDSYFDKGMGKLHDKEFDKFLKENGIEPKNLIYNKNKNGNKEYWSNVDKFRDLIEDFGKQQYNNGKSVIAEGIQIYDETFSVGNDYSWLKDKPIIITGTSKIKSAYRAIKRDEMDLSYNNIKNKLDWYKVSNTQIKKLQNDLDINNKINPNISNKKIRDI